MTNGWLMMINVVKTMPQTTHLGMVYTTYLWWNWWWFIPGLPTLLHRKPQLGMALFFVFHVFFISPPNISSGFPKKSTSSHWVNWHQFGMTQVFQNWFEETLWGKSDMGLFDFSSDIKMWWFITIFWKKLPCWGMPPLDKRNVFGLQKKYGSCSRSLNPVNVPFIFFSEIYGRMKNLWKYEMALAVRLGTMCRCSLGWSIVISVISIIYSESRLFHK